MESFGRNARSETGLASGRFDRSYAIGFAALTVVCLLTVQVATTNVWAGIARFLVD